MARKITIDRVMLLAVGLAAGWVIGRSTEIADPKDGEGERTASLAKGHAGPNGNGGPGAVPPSPSATSARSLSGHVAPRW